jgi:guanine deaminase
MLIRGGLVLVEGAAFQPVSLLLERGQIEAILPGDPGDIEDAEVLDASGRLIMPGLVNAHTHSHGGLGRGAVDDRATLEGFLATGGAINGGRNWEDMYLSASLSAIELIRKGCTACFDLCVELPAPSVTGLHQVGQAYWDVGIRAVVAPMIADQSLYQALPGLLDFFEPEARRALQAFRMPPWEGILSTCVEAVHTWPFATDWVKPGIGPTIPLHCSDDFLQACGQAAEDLDLPMQTHLAETKTQAQLARRKYGHSMVEHLKKLGILSPRLSGAHGIWLDPQEMAELAAHGVGISHNPLSNLRIGSGIASVSEMMAAGVTVGIGTDATNTSDGQNMFEAQRLASYLSRVRSFSPEDWIGAQQALQMATLNSAKILGFETIGQIAPGYAADLVFLDRQYCHYVPLRDPLLQMVMAESGAAIREVMIGGRMVLKDNQILTVDEASLYAKAEAAAQRLDEANADARRQSQAVRALVESFCLGQCRSTPHWGRFVDEANA